MGRTRGIKDSPTEPGEVTQDGDQAGAEFSDELDQPVEFFESWLSRILKMTTKAGRIKLERVHHSLTPKPDQHKAPRSLLL